MRRHAFAAVVAACFLLPAAPAFGATGALTITGTTGDDSITIAPGANNPVITFSPSGVTVTCPGGTTLASGAECPATDGVTSISAALLAGNDRLVTSSDVDIPISASGGPGDDDLEGGSGPDFLNGDGGEDDIEGGAGNDTISGGQDGDTLNGGDGNDTVIGAEGDDVINGGNGPDTLEGDDGNDTINGDDGNDSVSGGVGDDVLSGGNGADSLEGGDGADRLDGGDGPDFLEGDAGGDHLDGGAGDDQVYGGDDADVLIGGDGRDNLFGGSGDDRLELRDGLFDQAECGSGTDTAVADALDALASDCEVLDLPPVPPPPAPAAPPAISSPSVSSPQTPVAVVASTARPRAAGRVKIRVGPRRDRRAPYAYRVVGRITPPAGVDPRTACADVGLIDVQVHRGAAVLLTVRPRLRPDCTFEARVSFAGPAHLRSTKLRFTAGFLGNAYLSPARAASVVVRAG